MKTKLLKLALCAVLLSVSTAISAETAVRTTATWLFNQFYSNATVVTITTTSSTKGKVYDFDNLFLCVGNGSEGRTRTVTAQAAATMPNATAPSASDVTPFAKGDYVGLKFNAESRTPGATTADNASNYDLASFKAASAGKLYVLATTNSSDKTLSIHQNTSGTVTQVATATRSTSDWVLLSCDVANGSRYYIGSNDAWILYGVKFVPTTDATANANHNKTVSITNGYATFSSACNYSVPAGYAAYVVSGVDASKATLTQITHIPSNTGVILVGASAASITMQNIRESDITATDKTTAATNNLIANVGSYDLPADNGTYYNYTLAVGPTFKHSSGSGNLAANKAYLRTTTDVTEAHGLEVVFEEGGTTGISATQMNNDRMDNVYYDLQGRRVAQPTKGLYIVNGKKVINK